MAMVRDRRVDCGGEAGSMLLGLVVAVFLILLVLGIAAPKVAQELRRERDVEAMHRGNQYVRAIQLYYRKVGTYPGSLEQLEKTNNVRFLRQQYVDPLTGKADWKLIKVGEAKTTVKGFFGQPLTGLAPGLGSAAGMASSGGIGAGARGTGGNSAAGSSSGSAFGSSSGSAFGSSSGSSFGGSSSGSAFGSSSGSAFGGGSSSAFGSDTGSAGAGAAGSPGSSGVGSTGLGGSSSIGGSGPGTGTGAGAGTTGSDSSQSGSGMPSGVAPFVGVGLPVPGDSIVVLNEQTTYLTWEFLYDPRIEQLKAQASLFGGASSAGSAGALGASVPRCPRAHVLAGSG